MMRLIVFFSTPYSFAPALLPVLAYEGEAYWPRVGGNLGSVAIVIIGVVVLWVRAWTHQPTFSLVSTIFWATTIGILIVFPLDVLLEAPSEKQHYYGSVLASGDGRHRFITCIIPA